MTPLISILNISKRFPGVVALNDVSFDIQAGELHAVVGENGAGKSTLMRILSGVITDFDGYLSLRDQAIRFRGTRDAEEAGISIIHQELNLVEDLSAAANIFLGREKRTRLGLLDNRAMGFRLRRGEVLGIAGLMGAGRTELLECLFGSSPELPQGRILLEGRPVR